MFSGQSKILMKWVEIVPHLSQWKNGILDVITKCPILVIYENDFWKGLKIEKGCILEVKRFEELAEPSLLWPKVSLTFVGLTFLSTFWYFLLDFEPQVTTYWRYNFGILFEFIMTRWQWILMPFILYFSLQLILN